MSRTRAGPAAAASGNDFVTRPLVFAGAFDTRLCERAARLGLERPGVAHSLEYGGPDSRLAISHWIERDRRSEWLFRRLETTFRQLNAWYRFAADGILEPLLLARYPVGPGFTWHVDALDGPTSTRKVSLSVQLSDGDAYEGGDLEFIPDGVLQLSRLRGTVIGFPSFCAHRVTPITRGERLVLVGWMHGPSFR